MIFFLIQWFTALGWHVPTFFEYTSTRVILAAMTSLIFCLFLGPWFIKKLYELKIGQPIRDDADLLAELHKNKKNTPTMGGILMLFSLVVSLLLWMDLSSSFTLILLLTTLVIGFMGGRDDYLKLRFKNSKGLSARKKLLVQLIWALCVVSYVQLPQLQSQIQVGSIFKAPIIKDYTVKAEDSANIRGKKVSLSEFSSQLYVPFIKEPVVKFSGFGLLILWGFLLFVIVGSSNAVNLTDGLDGLAAGSVFMVAFTLGVFAFLSNNQELCDYLNISYIEGSGEIAVFLAATCGACLGFLWFNSHPAQVFMGDVGSLTLGAIVGVSSVLLGRECLLGLIGGVFVAEAGSVILQVLSYKYRNKKRIFLCAPLHHHFEYKGWAETKVVIRFWIIGFLLSMLGIISLKLQ